MVNAIHWDVSAQIFENFKTPNLYSLLFVSGMIIGYFVVRKMYRKEGIDEALLDKLVIYMVVPTIVGARLGHVLFYGPWFDTFNAQGLLIERGYFSHPLDILKVYEGGLASHGAAIAILISLFIYKKYVIKKSYLWILDRISAPIAIGGAFIRLGNLVNHEMVGKETNMPWGFKFLHHDCLYPYECSWTMIPTRHPAQLYESILYFISFFILLFLFWKKESWKKPGFIFGTFLILIFGARIIVEFFKENQSVTDDWVQATFGFNTGQWLSLPLVIAGIYLVYKAVKNKNISAE